MKKALSILLVFALFLLPIFSLTSCDDSNKQLTVVGEVVYVKYNEANMNAGNQDYVVYYVYLKPLGNHTNDDLVLFSVYNQTQMESSFSLNLDNIPELAVGSVVEIVYNTEAAESPVSLLIHGYEAHSIKRTDNVNNIKNPDFTPKLTEGYEFTKNASLGKQDYGTVVYVAEIKAPIEGYIIYLDDTGYSNNEILTSYWVEKEALKNGSIFADDEVISLIETRAIGYQIEIFSLQLYPFEDSGMPAIFDIDLYN